MTISERGVALVKDFEGCRLTSYQDQAGIWTIGYGHTGNIGAGMTISQAQAEDFLLQDLEHTGAGIDCMVNVPLSQNQYDSLSSFVFNIGRGNFKESTCLSRLNQGLYLQAANWLLPWHRIHVNGVEVEDEGLLNRRTAERALFLKADNA